MALAQKREIPPHVPPHLVVNVPMFSRTPHRENPNEVLVPEMHRSLPPVCYVPDIFAGIYPAWLLMRAEDVHDVLRDAVNFTKNGMGKFAQSIGEDWLSIPTETDPPFHASYRKAVNPYFSPSRMLAMRDQLRLRARNLIAAFKDRGECDFIAEFSERFPIFVALDLLGLPYERVAEFLTWEKALVYGDWEERTRAVRLVKNYLMEEIDRRSEEPADDYITHVTNFDFEGRKWTRDEVFGHCFNLFIGGLDTVTSLLGGLFRFLADNPAQQTELRGSPSKIPLAVEELLRAYAPVTVYRIANKEIKIRGETIMPGDYVTISTPIVGRDPLCYEAPNEVRFDRKPRHISLGDGIHRCLGMHLARLEIQIAFEEFLAAVPPFRVKDGLRLQYYSAVIIHLKELHLQWT
jgi:cytochrome P450